MHHNLMKKSLIDNLASSRSNRQVQMYRVQTDNDKAFHQCSKSSKWVYSHMTMTMIRDH